MVSGLSVRFFYVQHHWPFRNSGICPPSQYFVSLLFCNLPPVAILRQRATLLRPLNLISDENKKIYSSPDAGSPLPRSDHIASSREHSSQDGQPEPCR